MAKKINPKNVMKSAVMADVAEALEAKGYTVLDGEDFGFTSGTKVVRGEKFDMQLKPIAPKAGVDRYAEQEEE